MSEAYFTKAGRASVARTRSAKKKAAPKDIVSEGQFERILDTWEIHYERRVLGRWVSCGIDLSTDLEKPRFTTSGLMKMCMKALDGTQNHYRATVFERKNPIFSIEKYKPLGAK